jgi:beta-glucosidase
VLGVPWDIRWGRTYECYSEEVDIVEAMGPAYIRGMIDTGAAPSSKHFGPEGQTTNGRNDGNANISIDDYRPIAQPYRAALEAGVMCVMASYGSRNGKEIHEDKELLNDLLKGRVEDGGLEFEGMIITDWNSINQISGSDYREKLGKGINAGVDMVMAAASPENWRDTITGLKALTPTVIPQDRIDDAVMRILLFKKAIGYGTEKLFWNTAGATDEEISPLLTSSNIRTENYGMKIGAELVSQSLVLLRNESVTIQKLNEVSSILLVGTGGDDVGLACGGWTVSWQGAAGNTTAGVTLKKALEDAGKNVYYAASPSSGTNPPTVIPGEATGDIVIAVISETPYAEGSGDVTDQVIQPRAYDRGTLSAARTWATNNNKPLILIIYSGRPLHLSDAQIESTDAIVAAWWPGSEAGTGIVDVLLGDKDFVGATPYTWKTANNGTVTFPFGYGLRKSGETINP